MFSELMNRVAVVKNYVGIEYEDFDRRSWWHNSFHPFCFGV